MQLWRAGLRYQKDNRQATGTFLIVITSRPDFRSLQDFGSLYRWHGLVSKSAKSVNLVRAFEKESLRWHLPKITPDERQCMHPRVGNNWNHAVENLLI